MRSQYGSVPQQAGTGEWSVTKNASGGSLSPVASFNFYLTLVNRVGKSLLSTPKNIAIDQDDSITITIDSGIVQPAEDLWRIIISGEITGNSSDAVQLAAVEYKSPVDQITTESFPVTVTFTIDYHVETTQLNVLNFAALPVNTLNGQIRSIDSEGGQIYVRNEFESNWQLYYFSTIFTEQDNTENAEGCDQALGADLIIPPLAFDTEVTTITTTPVRYWLINEAPEGNGPSLTGMVDMIVSVNGNTVSDEGTYFGDIYSGIIQFQLIGYYRILARSLDTNITGVGVTQTWNAGSNQLRFPSALPPGFVAVFDIWLEADTSLFALTGYQAGNPIAISFQYIGRRGRFEPVFSALLGDSIVSGQDEGLKVVPNKVLTGSAIVERFFFSIDTVEEGVFNAILPETSNQSVIVNGATGGTFRTSSAPANLFTTEGIRAIVSTEAGFTNPSENSELVDLTTPGGLEITFLHPYDSGTATIRADYPDPAIAGNNQADWTNPQMRIYLIYNEITLYERIPLLASDSAASQIFQITDLSDFQVIASTPDAVTVFGANFSLFAPIKPDTPTIIAGSLPTGTYRVAVRYEYSSPNFQLTRIDHDVDGVTLPALNSTFEEILANQPLWRDQTLTVAQARDLAENQRINNTVWLITDLGNAPYILQLGLSSADDGRSVIRFNSGIGGFIPLRTLGLAIGSSDGTLSDRYSTLRFASPLVVTPDAQGLSNQISIDQDLLNTPVVQTNLLDSNFDFLTSTGGELLVW